MPTSAVEVLDEAKQLLAGRYHGRMPLPFDSRYAEADEEREDSAAMRAAEKLAVEDLQVVLPCIEDFCRKRFEAEHNEEAASFSGEVANAESILRERGLAPDVICALNKIACELEAISPTSLAAQRKRWEEELLSGEAKSAAAAVWDQAHGEKMARLMQSLRPGEVVQTMENSEVAETALHAALQATREGGSDV